MQKATIKDPQFVSTRGYKFFQNPLRVEPSTYEVAYGVLVSHPRAGEGHLHVGHLVRTSRVVRKYKNGNFRTYNTHYTVLKG